MHFWQTIGALLRRFYVGPPIILFSIAAGALVSYLVPAVHQSHAFVVLTAPTSGGSLSLDTDKPLGVTNPLLQFNDGLRTTTAILIHSLSTPDAMRELGVTEDGPTELVIDDGRSNPDLLGANGPFIYVESESRFAEDARAVVVRAVGRIRTELVERQESLGVPVSTFIEVVDVVPPSAPEQLISDRLQAGGAALVAGLLGGFSMAYGIERARLSRRRRKQIRSQYDQYVRAMGEQQHVSQHGAPVIPSSGPDATQDHQAAQKATSSVDQVPAHEPAAMPEKDHQLERAEEDGTSQARGDGTAVNGSPRTSGLAVFARRIR